MKSTSVCVLIVIAAAYFLNWAAASRGFLILFGACSIFALFAKDVGFEAYLRAHRKRGKVSRPVVLVGSEERNTEFERLLDDHPEMEFPETWRNWIRAATRFQI